MPVASGEDKALADPVARGEPQILHNTKLRTLCNPKNCTLNNNRQSFMTSLANVSASTRPSSGRLYTKEYKYSKFFR
jgi:hypothetical protein